MDLDRVVQVAEAERKLNPLFVQAAMVYLIQTAVVFHSQNQALHNRAIHRLAQWIVSGARGQRLDLVAQVAVEEHKRKLAPSRYLRPMEEQRVPEARRIHNHATLKLVSHTPGFPVCLVHVIKLAAEEHKLGR